MHELECAGSAARLYVCHGGGGDDLESVDPEIRYFDESDHHAAIRRAEPAGQMRIANDLALARSSDERIRLVKGMLSLVGFAEVGYVSVRLDAQAQIDRAYVSRSFQSENLCRRYFDLGRHRRDPRITNVLSARIPFVWDLRTLADAWRRADSAASMRAAIDELREHGAGCGVIFGIPVPKTRLRAIVSFTSPAEHAGWITDSVVAQALALGLAIHQQCSSAVRALEHGGADADLSDVQVRILRFLAVGLSDKEIALRMHTTPHNVDYHLRRLRQKCGVNSRAQLAFLAGRVLGP